MFRAFTLLKMAWRCFESPSLPCYPFLLFRARHYNQFLCHCTDRFVQRFGPISSDPSVFSCDSNPDAIPQIGACLDVRLISKEGLDLRSVLSCRHWLDLDGLCRDWAHDGVISEVKWVCWGFVLVVDDDAAAPLLLLLLTSSHQQAPPTNTDTK